MDHPELAEDYKSKIDKIRKITEDPKAMQEIGHWREFKTSRQPEELYVFGIPFAIFFSVIEFMGYKNEKRREEKTLQPATSPQ